LLSPQSAKCLIKWLHYPPQGSTLGSLIFKGWVQCFSMKVVINKCFLLNH